MNRIPGEARGALAWSVSLGVGFLPGPTGTWGSLLTAALAWLWLIAGGAPLCGYGYVLFLAFLSGLAIWLSDLAEKRAVFGPKTDPGQVVIDEAAGQLIALYAASATVWWEFPLAFFLFRGFDVLKPFPINRLQSLPGGVGIVLDDLLAGIYALVVMALTRYFLA